MTDDRALFINRELSWLEFNARVLDQARDSRVPLLERMKFLAIFGSNLDEFFMIRVSGLHEQLQSRVGSTAPDGLSVVDQLARIRERVLAMTASATKLLREELAVELERAGIRVLGWKQLSRSQREWARHHFRKAVFPVLTPLAVDPAHPFPFLSNLSLSLAVEAADPATGERRFVRIKVPEILPRFVPIEGGTDFLLLEDLIGANLSDLLPGTEIIGSHPFRVTRDMDIDILEDEASDLLSLVDRQIRQRRFGAAVRLEVSPKLPARVRAMLLSKLEIDDDDVYEVDGLLGLSGLFALAQLPRPELRDPPMIPSMPAEWTEEDPFALLARKDVLLRHPADSFEVVLDLLRRAADDPDVLAIKMTLYRAGANSEAVRTLIRAAENGKQVAVSLELKARFDEANNVAWARAFERAGVHVFFGTAGSKTHAKILLVVRREGPVLRRYVHLATGNYNAATAKLYTDLALLTSDDAFGEDACELFNMLSGFARQTSFRKLVVAPVALRPTILAQIGAQAERARAGKPARIFAKLNSLVDPEVIRALYAASQAGVDIELVVRGICCLRPGVPGVSERIRAWSLLGRFLEHERVFAFGPIGAEEVYLSSADWMPRNLDRRVELMVPVADEGIRARIREACMRPLESHAGAIYALDATGAYRRVEPVAEERGESSLSAAAGARS